MSFADVPKLAQNGSYRHRGPRIHPHPQCGKNLHRFESSVVTIWARTSPSFFRNKLERAWRLLKNCLRLSPNIWHSWLPLHPAAPQEDTMYARMIQLTAKSGQGKDLSKVMRERALPILKQQPSSSMHWL